MSEVIKPIMLDETGKAIVAALLQNDIVAAKTAEISAAAEEIKNEVLASIPEDYTELTNEVDEIQETMFHQIANADDFVASISDASAKNYSNVTGDIIIDSPVNIADRTICTYKTYIGGTFHLNSDLFTWSNIRQYHSIPNFIGCIFIGNGHNIVAEGGYPTSGKFTNCFFIDCGIIKNGHFAQSQRFVNCRMIMSVDHPFIHANQVYDTRFIGCQLESDNKAPMIIADGTGVSMNTVSEVSFTDCIIESQTTELVNMRDGQIKFTNCYTEVTKELVKVEHTNFAQNGLLTICCTGCRLQPNADDYCFNIDISFDGSIRSFVDIRDCYLNVGRLINRNNFFKYHADNVVCSSGGQILPSSELSKMGSTAKNSIAKFDAQDSSLVHVKKTPCLITYNNSYGGWKTQLLFVSSAHGNPKAVNLTNPEAQPTAVINSETGLIDVTLDPIRSDTEDMSAIYLPGIVNQLNLTDYWRATNGYNV